MQEAFNSFPDSRGVEEGDADFEWDKKLSIPFRIPGASKSSRATVFLGIFQFLSGFQIIILILSYTLTTEAFNSFPDSSSC